MPHKDSEKRKAYGREWQKRNQHKHREYYLKHREERIARCKARRLERLAKLPPKLPAVCPICNRVRMLVRDHHHLSGVNRDRICGHCNAVLGFAKEDEAILESAKKYLQRWKQYSGVPSEG